MLGASLKAQVSAQRELPKHTALCSSPWLSTSFSFYSLTKKAELNLYVSMDSGCFLVELISGKFLY